MPDPYLIPGTVVLQNKLGISDFDELEQAVADIGDAMAYRLFDKNTCACRKSNSHIPMMKSAKKWRRQNATNGMYGSRRRRVLVE